MNRLSRLVLFIALLPTVLAGADDPIRFDAAPGRLTILDQGHPIAVYVYKDADTPRPYFTALKTRDGRQLTRNHPPQSGDRDDHPRMHPGLWLAFGDLGGADFWRLKNKVEQMEFIAPPKDGEFTVRNRYLAEDNTTTLVTEVTRYRFHSLKEGTLIEWDSLFTAADRPVTFGDQEEMGLGVRIGTPLAVVAGNGGRLLNSAKERNEKQIWGHTSDWCDYSGPLDDRWCGIAVFAAPDNPRKTWWHVRDYGVMVANSFGPRSGEPARPTLAPGGTLRLRFGILLHSTEKEDDLNLPEQFEAYQKGLTQAAAPNGA
jgi:hypothetical protein